MYIYNYVHVWQATRNVKNPPANNYAQKMDDNELRLVYMASADNVADLFQWCF